MSRRRKKKLIELACQQAEAAGIVQLNEDEAGPSQAIPQPGASWQPEGHPVLQPHEYERGGTAKLLTLCASGHRPGTRQGRRLGDQRGLASLASRAALGGVGRDREGASPSRTAPQSRASAVCTLENVAVAP